MTRKRLTDAAGCGIETVRYYEDARLMPEPAHGANGYRPYGPEDARRLGFILRARALGLSVEEVRDTTLSHLGAIRTRIADFRKLERTLADISSRCSGEAVPDCPVIDALMEGGG